MPGGWSAPTHGEGNSCTWDSSRPYPIYLHVTVQLYPLYSLSYSKLVNVNFLPEVCKSFQQIIASKEGVTGTLIYIWSIRNTDDNLDLELASKVGVGEQSLGLSP